MAEKDFRETFHQTRQPDFYDDHQSSLLNPNSEERADRDVHPEDGSLIPTAPPPTPMLVDAPPNIPVTPAPRSVVQVLQSNSGVIAPKFYDGRTNPRVWLNHYETIAEANLWSEDVKLKKVIAYLKGAAEDWLANRRLINPFINWLQFKDALISRFTNTLDDVMLNQNIIRYRQKQMDFDSYWEAKIGQIRLTSPGMSEKEVINHMFMGLNPELRIKVLDRMVTRRCETAEELQALIKETNDLMEYEREEKSSSYKYRGKYHSNTFVESEKRGYYPKRDDGERNRFRPKTNDSGKLDKLEKDIRQIKDGIEKIESSKKPNKNENKKKEEKKKLVCYNCNEEGHFSRECPKKQKIQKNQGNEQKRN